jgi:tetratricopeptide (TPR) repeat protein
MERLNEDYAGAYAQYTATLERDRGYAGGWLRRAIAGRRLGRSAAAADPAAVTAIDPLDREAPFFQARIAQAAGDFAAALQGFSTAIERTADYGLAY